MDQPPVDNDTEFEHHAQLIVDKDGERLLAMVKGTFHLVDGRLEIPDEPLRRLIRFADVPWGKPEISSIMYPSDVCVRKPKADIVIVARAHAPEGKAVPAFDVAARVGKVKKTLRVCGFRVWEKSGAGVTPPSPLEEIELRYDFAWGGSDVSDPTKIVEEPRNPVGRGVVRDVATLTHQPAPQIEDPAIPISSVRTRPPPAGVGPIGRHWEPRRRYLGTYDDVWFATRAPLPPLDQDDRMNNCATPDLVAPAIVGTEEVGLLNMRRGGGATHFHLPGLGVEIAFRVKDRDPEVLKPAIDTVLIDAFDTEPDEPLAVELVWRASVPAPRRMKDAEIQIRTRKVVIP